MANALFELGRQGLIDGTVDWDTNTIKTILLDLGTTDAGIKAITGATNATPIVVTATAHGFANGDIVVITGVAGNTAANNIWEIASVAANTFELKSVIDGTTNSVGNAAYTSGGTAVCLGPSASGDFLDDFSAARVGTDQTLGSKTVTQGTADAADATYTGLTGASVEAIGVYKDGGAEATSPMIAYYDGKHKVTCAAVAAASATTIAVEPLTAGISNGAVLVFSNGASATLSGAASAGARTLSVSALAAQITAGSYAQADATGSGLPFTPSGGNVVFQWDSGASRMFSFRNRV